MYMIYRFIPYLKKMIKQKHRPNTHPERVRKVNSPFHPRSTIQLANQPAKQSTLTDRLTNRNRAPEHS
ncbi:hypothetical protein PVAP13_8KG045300 [Panicum virgatum]|uniref:Uncharacterized protein n=1 Tax=Panicum virgatum TaxID=38727 RepID=A0A8T0PHQ9_PANVG|nr:hypothetical protein PVAP13_8KG045300 [Panicum virgatum]